MDVQLSSLNSALCTKLACSGRGGRGDCGRGGCDVGGSGGCGGGGGDGGKTKGGMMEKLKMEMEGWEGVKIEWRRYEDGVEVRWFSAEAA